MAAIPGFVQLVTDDFNRADQNPIAGNWTDSGGTSKFQILSNTATVTSVTADGEAIWNTWAGGIDHYSQADVTASGTSAGSGIGVYVRHAPTAATETGYRLVIDGAGNIELAKLVTAGYTFLASRNVTYVAGTKLGLAISGNTMTIWYGGAQQGASFTDVSSPLVAGVPGIAYSSSITSASLDNWDAGIPGGGITKLRLKPRPFKPAISRRR